VTNIMLGISLFGLQILWAVVTAVAVFCAIKRQWNHLAMWLIAWLGAELLTQALKLSFHRPRPVVPNPLLKAADFSFPSGHASVSLVVYGMLAFFILLQLRSQLLKALVIVVTVLLVLMIGISRLYLGVHYFSDVAAGYVMGVIWLTVCIDGMNILEHRKYLRNAKPPVVPEKTDAERAAEHP
jgi:undecaprenyl-diphosphatase